MSERPTAAARVYAQAYQAERQREVVAADEELHVALAELEAGSSSKTARTQAEALTRVEVRCTHAPAGRESAPGRAFPRATRQPGVWADFPASRAAHRVARDRRTRAGAPQTRSLRLLAASRAVWPRGGALSPVFLLRAGLRLLCGSA